MEKHVVCFAVAAVLCSCGSPAYYSRKHPAEPVRFPKEAADPEFYAQEHSYVRERRRSAGLTAMKTDGDHMPLDTVGIAFSGGGLRSAYFNLGVLEGLQGTGLLKKADYLSCVSGGSYIGAWLVSRWDNKKGCLARTYGKGPADARFYKSPDPILGQESCYKLETQRKGFVVGVTAEDKAKDIAHHATAYVAKFAPNLVFDVAAHFKPVPGKFNAYHLIYNYRYCLEKGFVPEVDHKKIALEDINPHGSTAPYLIMSSALANDEPWELGNFGRWAGTIVNPAKWTETHHFEFSRFQCGGPEIGYVSTKVFDHAVARTGKWSKDPALERSVPHEMEWRESVFPGMAPTKPFAVATAVAASGAAVDSAGTKYRAVVDRVLKPLNLNLRYQTSNYARNLTHPLLEPIDRLREILVDRFRPTYKSNSVYLSDGGHFDNLGITALVRRGVRTIYAFDADQDGDYDFNDIKNTKKRIESMKCPCCGGTLKWSIDPCSLPVTTWKDCQGRERKAMRNFVIKTRISGECGQYNADVYLIKASYLPCFDHEGHGIPAGSAAFAKENKVFPHEPTFHVAPYSQKMFDAYRDLGRFEANCLVSNTHSIDMKN